MIRFAWILLVAACADKGGGTDTFGGSSETSPTGSTATDPLQVDDDGDGFSEAEGDCDDDSPAVSPLETDLFGDGVDQDCDGADGFDGDGDGWASELSFGADCDDGDPAIHPEAAEVCDPADVDEDCDDAADDADPDGADGQVLAWPDGDRDGFGDALTAGLALCDPPDDLVLVGDDCADGDPDTFPGAPERCNSLDDDCDLAVPVDETTDADGDLHVACDDCDDAAPAVFPGAPELCDGLANACDGGWPVVPADELDGDGDGFVSCDALAPLAGGDCDDLDAGAFPGAVEITCDGVDQDCGGEVEHLVAVGSPIQDAVDLAAAGDAVCLGAGTWVENVRVEQDLDLIGAGSALTTIDGDSSGTVLAVQGDPAAMTFPAVTVQGLTLANGAHPLAGGLLAMDADVTGLDLHVIDATSGGGIRVDGFGSLVLDGFVVADNEGGGIVAPGRGDGLVASNGSITGNRNPLNGGGIDTCLDLVLTDVEVSGNTAQYAGGGIHAPEVCATNDGADVLELTRVVVADNEADDAGGILAGVDATFTEVDVVGNVDMDLAGGLWAQGHALTWTGGTISDNFSESGLGAMKVDVLALTDVTVANNVGHSTGGFIASYGLTATRCDVVGNLGEGGIGGFSSGGLAALDNVAIVGNVGTENAGASFGGDLDAENLIVAGNEATVTGAGGIFVYGVARVTNASFTGNRGPVGGALKVETSPTLVNVSFDHNDSPDGAAIHLVSGDLADARYCNFWANTGVALAGSPNPVGLNDNVAVDPAYAAFDLLGDPVLWDLHPTVGSALIDAGDPAILDPDGSVSDLGAYGGPGAAGW